MIENKLRSRNRVVPIFLATDDKYVKYMIVSLKSLIENSNCHYQYKIHILNTGLSEKNVQIIKRLETDNCQILFTDIKDELYKIEKKISIRDYYTATTYYRIFIAEMFPEYDKVIYIDCDTVILDDIAKLYQYKLGKNYIGAIRDQLVIQTDIYGDYVEKVLGISRGAYFNAGVALINCNQFRRQNMLKRFIDLLNTYTFVVAQDQDYLNILCKDNILWIDPRWNVQMIGTHMYEEHNIKLVHYNLAAKPWHYEDCPMGNHFWEYAKKTEVYDDLLQVLDNFTKEDAELDKSYGDNLQNLALAEIRNSSNYYNMFGGNEPLKLTRTEVLRRIAQYEKMGIFDKDVEDDPEGRELLPHEVDYLRKTVKSKIQTRYAFRIAHWYVDVLMQKKQFVIKDIKGLENFENLDSGAIITCNHFNAFDSFAMQLAYEKTTHRKRKFFRIISEANYTAFPGFYGFLMRNCNTLPLSSNRITMKKFLYSVDKILQRGDFILIYPEQSMWWNYRKPKPLKKGAFTFAAKNKVPVLPCFITMEDTDVMDSDGYPVQAYTIHIAPPIYPDTNKKKAENTVIMMEKNSEIWKEIYEKTYNIPLTYTCAE